MLSSRNDFIQAIAEQMASCADKAVECWMAELDSVLADPALTTLDRLQAVNAVISRYKQLTGKSRLDMRQPNRALA